jgi:hypothetical protein
MKKKFKLGPLQKKWIKALESNKYKQITRYLKNQNGYCCLGVAKEVCNLEEVSNYSLRYTYSELGLYDCEGISSDKKNALVLLNDNKKKSFKYIAYILKRYPERYFKESK